MHRSSSYASSPASPLPVPPIFAKYEQEARATRRRRSSAARRKRGGSGSSASQEKPEATRSVKIITLVSGSTDPMEIARERARAELSDLEHPPSEEILEDVARALYFQQRAKDRKAAALQALPKIPIDGSDNESPLCSSKSASSSTRERAFSSASSSSSRMNQVIFQSFPAQNAVEEEFYDSDASSTKPRRRFKSTQWLRRIASRASVSGTRSDEPSSPTKRLAPLSRFNPFVRARSESLSSITETSTPVPSPRRRIATIAEKGKV